MVVTKQSLASILRQLLAIVATVFGILTQSDSALHLPVSVSAILTAMGPVILAIEHYVGDPSTGTPAPRAPASQVAIDGSTNPPTLVYPPTSPAMPPKGA